MCSKRRCVSQKYVEKMAAAKASELSFFTRLGPLELNQIAKVLSVIAI